MWETWSPVSALFLSLCGSGPVVHVSEPPFAFFRSCLQTSLQVSSSGIPSPRDMGKI